MVKPFAAGVDADGVTLPEAVDGGTSPLSPTLFSPDSPPMIDDSAEAAPLAELPPRLMVQPARAPNERMETNKSF